MKIKISVNRDIIDRNINRVPMGTVDGYIDIPVEAFVNGIIKQGVAWCSAEFKDNKRVKKNFIQSEVIGIDIDSGWTLQDVFKDEFTINNALLLYTSPSHTTENHRFRIVFKLNESYTDHKQLETVIKHLIDYYKSDKNCSDCTHFFYGNTKAKVKVFNKIYTPKLKPQIEGKLPDIIKVKSKMQLRNMLLAIKSKNKTLEYKQWIELCSSIWSHFDFDESIRVLQEIYPEESTESYKYKYDHRLNDIPYSFFIKKAVQCGYEMPESEYPDFVRYTDEDKMIIPSVCVVDYLMSKNYFTFFPDANSPNLYQVIKEDNNILTETGLKLTSEYLQDHIIKNYSAGDAEILRSKLMQVSMNKVFTFLHSPETHIHRDTKDTCYFYFKNGFLEITKNDLQFHESYKELKELKIWKKGINNRDYIIDSGKCEFEQFLYNVSNKDPERFNLLCAVIGYLLHRYKDPHITKCVIFTDEVIDNDNPSGRTGKSLIMQAIGNVRNVLDEPAKTFDIQKQFCWQNVELSTEIIHLDDIPPNFHLKHFYPNITGNLKVEQKGLKSYILDFKKSPKFAFTSNYTVDTGGGSDRARVVELELHNYYNEYFQPVHEFNHRFFDDWESVEWNRFYTFMASCVQTYFKTGLLHTVSETLMRNKIIKQTSNLFADWVLGFDFYPKSGQKFFTHTGLYSNYMRMAQTAMDEEPITHIKFTMYLKKFFNMMEIKYRVCSQRTGIDSVAARGVEVMR